MSFISVHVGKYGATTAVVGRAHGPVVFKVDSELGPKPPEIVYDETATSFSMKKFWEDENKIILFAHKLQTYAMELLDEED